MFRTFAFVAALLWAAVPASAQTLPDDVSSLPWVFDGGGVYTSRQVGSTLFLGGNFDSAARPSDVIGHAAVLDAGTARLLAADPTLLGVASAIVDDGAGGWFLGGSFEIGGLVTPLVRLDASGRSTSVVPGVAGFLGGRVLTMARQGQRLIVGGDFTTLGGASRNRLAAVDTTNGQVLAWAPDVVGVAVRALHLAGSQLFVAGEFTSIDGQARSHLAKFDLASDTLTAWAPAVNGARVHALAALGSRVYAGGEFSAVAGQPRANFAALDSASGALDAMAPDPSGGQEIVFALATSGNTVYIGGQFAMLAGQPRISAGAIDGATGTPLPWSPLTERAVVVTLAVRGSDVFLGGGWLPGTPGGFAIKVDGTTAVRDAGWQPGLGSDVLASAVAGDRVAVAGNFSTYHTTHVVGLAAIDLASGQLLTLPEFDGAVYSLAPSGSTLYFGGFFTFVGNQPRWSIAAVDTVSRTLLPFAPVIFGSTLPLVESIALAGSDLYLGGRFVSVNGLTRSSLAAVDAVSGATRPFAAGAIVNQTFDPDVVALEVAQGRVWAAGYFTAVGGAPRSGLAVFDATTGALDPLDLSAPGSVVLALVPSGTAMFVAGNFQLFGNLLRDGLAKVHAGTGAVDPWSPPIRGNGSVAVSAGLAFAGGSPTGLPVPGSFGSLVLALDAVTAAPVAWDPALPSRPEKLFEGPDGLLAASFIGANGPAASFFARRTAAGAPHAPSDFGVHVQGTRLLVRWTPALSGPLPTSYTLVAGSRPGASDLAAVPFPRNAGTGVVIDAPPGTYFLRVVPRANGLNGPASREVAFTAGPIGCAPPPLAPTLGVIAGGTPQLAWTPSAGDPVSGYELRVGLTPGVRTAALIPLPGVTTTFSTAGAPPGTYYATVAASYTCGATVESNEVQVVVPPPGAPAAPTALAAAVSGRTVSLSWTPPAGAITGYVLEAGSAPGLANIIPGLALGGAPGIVAPNVPPGSYYVRVRAVNASLVSVPSSEIVVTVP